jgi:hypothetical protein
VGLEVEQLALAHGVVRGGLDHAALVVVVAQEHVQRHPRQHVVEAVGVLGWSAVDVDGGGLAVAGQLARDGDDVLLFHVRDIRPLRDRVLAGRVQQDLKTALHVRAVL